MLDDVTSPCKYKIIMQVLTIYGRGIVRIKNVNSHPFIRVCIPVNYNKTANINVKKLHSLTKC